MKLRAVNFRIIVKPDEIKRKTKSGIVIEYGSNEQLEKGARVAGIVLDIGPAAFRAFGMDPENPWVKVGDRVFYAKYAGKRIIDTRTGEEVVVINDEDIVAVDDDHDYELEAESA